MAEAKARERWSHTSSLMALIANCNRDPKRRARPFRPDEFNPLVGRRPRTNGIPIRADNIEDLKVFLPKDRRHAGR